MTLLQLKYVLTVAQTGTISDAAKELFIAQPSLTSAIKDLETELGIEIFHRTRKGVTVTTEGEEFLSYARQVIEQTNLIEEKYFHHGPVKHQFCVSCQHYSFTAEAFIELLKNYDGNQYDFRIRETTTYEIIEDVARLRSEIGVLYLNDFNKAILKKTLRENNLKFHSLFIARPHVFLSSNHPLAAKDPVTLEDLDPYPRLAYEQGTHNSFYFSEEILSTRNCKKDIMVRDRGDSLQLSHRSERIHHQQWHHQRSAQRSKNRPPPPRRRRLHEYRLHHKCQNHSRSLCAAVRKTIEKIY